MDTVKLRIDDRDAEGHPGDTVLEVASSIGIDIPTLCFHKELEPYGGCRLCIVEIEKGGRKRLVVSCVFPIEDGLVVRTRSEKIDKIRRVLVELLLSHAPDAPFIKKLAKEYGAKLERFEKEASFCVHCGLCVRYCSEVKKKFAVGFIERGMKKEISFIPEIALKECDACKECFSLCPTSYLQACHVLLGGMFRERRVG